jgi:hypothetical protein
MNERRQGKQLRLECEGGRMDVEVEGSRGGMRCDADGNLDFARLGDVEM